MPRRDSGNDVSPELRQFVRDQTLTALERWLNLDADTPRPDLFWVWPTLATTAGILWFTVTTTGFDAQAAFASGSLICGGLATLVDRIRDRARRKARLSLTASVMRLVAGTATPLPRPVAAVSAPPPQPEVAGPVRPTSPAVADPATHPLPPVIAAALGRARDACAGIGRLAADPVWARTQVPVAEHEARARAQLQALEERARRLALVHGLLVSSEGSPQTPAHLGALAEIYESHCRGLASAAEVFEEAQASLARALLAVADGAPGAGAPDAALREIGAAFGSLAQVLESLGEVPSSGSQGWPQATAAQASAPSRSRI